MTEPLIPEPAGRPECALSRMMRMVGRMGDNWGEDKQVAKAKKYTVLREGDDGWELQPSRRHPLVHCWYAGYLRHGYTFQFRVPGSTDLLDDTVDWATYDSLGQLIVAKLGVVTVYELTARKNLSKRFEFDFESLAPKKPDGGSL